MMISITNEDYLVLARAKGLTKARVFWRYAVRNAMLPQVTALAMSLGGVVSGSTLVEVWFSYPGIGFTLYNAIRDTDYTLIQGITFLMVVATAARLTRRRREDAGFGGLDCQGLSPSSRPRRPDSP